MRPALSGFRAEGDRRAVLRRRLDMIRRDDTSRAVAADFIMMATLRTKAAPADIFKAVT